MPHGPVTHHLHKRKRTKIKTRFKQRLKGKKLEPYPSPSPVKRIIDAAVYVAGLIVPLMALIQSVKIYQAQNAEGVSVVAFSGFVIANIVWLIYGIVHKERPLILMYVLLCMINLSIAVGAYFYG